LESQTYKYNCILYDINFYLPIWSKRAWGRKEGRKMYKKIMVPLDGSELAECVLPHVEAFIKGSNTSDVILVRVVEPEISYSGEYVISPEVIAKWESEMKSFAKDYLDKIVNRLKHEGTTLHAEVIVGRVTESLANYAVENDIDLIIIATHGHSGVTRWVRGSVADKILRSADVPVLMVRAPGTKGGI
jgi:nucleotide-binding universal stress UspA family protein